ncbi:cyclic nucleotide-binding domain-containing protein [Actinoplanes sp. NPDC051851]|uniref:cyclic nucleotide-binding domain-containing protein n=1 Tax=Actinoplanes sp. NPDC051851 TaxID=3154753 RepID=UPI003441419E
MAPGEAGRTTVAIVSCDIVSHSAESDIDVQTQRVTAINRIVTAAIAGAGAGHAVWASGGDGGHVIFRGDGWPAHALALVAALRGWSASEKVPLRVTAHVGRVRFLAGADGRAQAVGDGINAAGWLLSRGPAAGVLVSRAFREAIEESGAGVPVLFDGDRSLRDKTGRAQQLQLMSVGADRSTWDSPTEEDRRRLHSAERAGAGWETIYWAKRILQINRRDAEAEDAIGRLQRRQLGYLREEVRGESNPFFELLTQNDLREVILAGHLVERDYNEYICRTGDEGETMFVILRGQVGVYLPGTQAESDGVAQPDFTHEEGEIVGELAFAMSRRRTADLVALTDTTLLTFDIREMERRLPRNAWKNVGAFIRARTLEHVSQRVPYLVGANQSGPLTGADRPWERILAEIEDHCDLLPLQRTGSTRLTFDRVRNLDDANGHGIWLLVGGRLRGLTESEPPGARVPGSSLAGEDYPLLWVDLPGTVVLPKWEFHIEKEPVTILHLRESGLVRLDAPQRDAFYRDLRLAAANCFEYDAFLSYNSGDTETADRWQRALTEAGLHVFRDVPTHGEEFPSRLLAAIRQSRALVAFVSPHVMVRSPAENWVMREINAHRYYFDESRVFPVILPGGSHRDIVRGFTPIKVDRDEAGAMARLVSELKALRDGVREPPYGYAEKPDVPGGFVSAT